ncbi:hypothetical protein BU16DRAFT_88597 [Lophium mytilinum]|uniref:Uncharacterized protein n=1 Tax=Lophium mytilinum TaxID=390894 RepID=A0A6A6QP67_9PEZI|nr:hypothetical protein BU16DRAFT_88597 [Lophium mytilinum]
MPTTLNNKSRSPPPINLALISSTEKAELHSSALSITSSSTAFTTSTSTTLSPSPFVPASTLHITTRGIPLLRPPLAPSALTTQIQRVGRDGALAYTSTRPSRCSGSCVLANAAATPLISTTYFWGPGRDPVLTYLHQDTDTDADVVKPSTDTIKTTSKWTSRAQTFVLADGRAFEWAYVRERAAVPGDTGDGGKREGAKVVNLVLWRTDPSTNPPTSHPPTSRRRVAQLVRNDKTRAAGSSRSSAGNGGELQLAAPQAGDLDEAGVVASCLVMLKKEVDRRRTVQMMAMGGGAGS